MRPCAKPTQALLPTLPTDAITIEKPYRKNHDGAVPAQGAFQETRLSDGA